MRPAYPWEREAGCMEELPRKNRWRRAPKRGNEPRPSLERATRASGLPGKEEELGQEDCAHGRAR